MQPVAIPREMCKKVPATIHEGLQTVLMANKPAEEWFLCAKMKYCLREQLFYDEVKINLNAKNLKTLKENFNNRPRYA